MFIKDFINIFPKLGKSPLFQGSILACFLSLFERFRDFGLFYKGFCLVKTPPNLRFGKDC